MYQTSMSNDPTLQSTLLRNLKRYNDAAECLPFHIHPLINWYYDMNGRSLDSQKMPRVIGHMVCMPLPAALEGW